MLARLSRCRLFLLTWKTRSTETPLTGASQACNTSNMTDHERTVAPCGLLNTISWNAALGETHKGCNMNFQVTIINYGDDVFMFQIAWSWLINYAHSLERVYLFIFSCKAFWDITQGRANTAFLTYINTRTWKEEALLKLLWAVGHQYEQLYRRKHGHHYKHCHKKSS